MKPHIHHYNHFLAHFDWVTVMSAFWWQDSVFHQSSLLRNIWKQILWKVKHEESGDISHFLHLLTIRCYPIKYCTRETYGVLSWKDLLRENWSANGQTAQGGLENSSYIILMGMDWGDALKMLAWPTVSDRFYRLNNTEFFPYVLPADGLCISRP